MPEHIKSPDSLSEKFQKKPFEIRGHHLLHYIYLTSSKLPPEKVAFNQRKGLENNLNESRRLIDSGVTTGELQRGAFIEIGNPQYWLNYYVDILGDTPKHSDLYEKNLVEIFVAFRDLPKNSTIKLFPGKPDEMCKSCTGEGNHCRMQNIKKFSASTDILEDDQIYVNTFLNAAKNAKTEKFITDEIDVTVFSDTGTKQIAAHMMPVGQFRNTLTHIIENANMYPLFAPAIY